MTSQEVIQKFMKSLANHGYANSSNIKMNMLDSAIRASSRFDDIQDVIDAMKADQVKAEKEAVEEVLGSQYAGKLISEVDSNILRADAKGYDTANKSNAYFNQYNDGRTTVERLIKERKAYIFLEKYCGVQLEKKYWITSSEVTTYWENVTTGNKDTGAITGSDANITLKAGDKDYYGNELDFNALANQDGISLAGDGSLIIGTGFEKTDRSVVPEVLINTYTANNSDAQEINTGSRGWVVQATGEDDTITSGGADSINAGDGDDFITANADGSTITAGSGADKIEISAQVKDITLTDLNSEDEITISGKFEAGAAKIEDLMLVITDKTGTRKIKLANFETAKNTRLNSTTIAKWLADSGIDLDNLKQTTYAADIGVSSSNVQAPSNAQAEGDGRTPIDSDWQPSAVEEVPVQETSKTSGTKRGVALRNSRGGDTGTVNLDNYTTLSSGDNVTVDGEIVGTVSSTYPNATIFTRNGLTIHLLGVSSSTSGHPDYISVKTLDQLTDDQKTIIAGLFKWWGSDCLKLNEDSYGISFNSDTAAVKDIGVFFYDGKSTSNALASVWNWQRASYDGAGVQLMLNVNVDYYKNLSDTDVEGTTSAIGAGFLDRTLAHEFTHALMASNVNYFQSLPKFIKEGIAELTHGIDDERGNSIFKIAYDAAQLEASIALDNTGTGSQAVGDGYSGGFMFLRYFARQAALQTLNYSAFGDISVNVDLSKLNNLTSGKVIYIDTRQKNPKIQVATSIGDFNTLNTSKFFASLGVIDTSTDGKLLYNVCCGIGIKQNLTLGSNVAQAVNLDANITLNGTSGADTVKTTVGANEINLGAGDDSLSLGGQYATVFAGAGSDTVLVVDGDHHLIDLGDGDNVVNFQSAFTFGNTITGGADSDRVSLNGADNFINLGDGADSLATANYIDNTNNFFNTDAGDDKITVGAGNNSTFLAGEGDDLIQFLNFNSDTAITANHIDAGAGDDSIIVYGSNNTIFGGEGNDTIQSGGSGGNFFAYNAAFDNDKIQGFKSNDTILIPKDCTADYDSSTKILTVRKDEKVQGTIKIETAIGVTFDTSKNVAANLAKDWISIDDFTYNSAGGYYEISSAADLKRLSAFVNEGNDCTGLEFKLTDNITLTSYFTPIKDFAGTFDGNEHLIIAAGKIFGDNVSGNVNGYFYSAKTTISDEKLTRVFKLTAPEHFSLSDVTGGIVHGGNVYSSGEVSFKLTAEELADNATWQISDNPKLNDNEITSTDGFYSVNITGDAQISANFYISVNGGSFTNSEANISVVGSAEDEIITNTAANVTLSGGGGNDTFQIGVDVSKITISDFNTGDTIQLAQTGTLETVDGGIKIGNLTINGVDKLTAVTTSWTTETNGFSYKRTTAEGAKLDDKTITYKSAAEEKLFTLTNVKDTAGITVDTQAKTVTLGKDNLTDANVTIDGEGYTLTLDGVDAPENTAAGFDGLTYKSASNTAGYTLATDKKSIAYTAASGGEVLFTLANVRNTNSILVDTEAKTVTLGKNNLKNADVTIDGDFTLKLSADVPTSPDKVATAWLADGSNYTCKDNASVAFYTLIDKKISYTPPQGGEELFTLSGLKSDLIIDENLITVGEADADGKRTVTINDTSIFPASNGNISLIPKSGSYTLAFAENISDTENLLVKDITSGWSGNTYTAAGKTAGYSLSDNQISYTAQTGGESFTISGVASTNAISVNGKTVTVSKASLKDSSVEISTTEGYVLALGSDIEGVKTTPAGWSLNGSTAAYKTASTSEGYALNGNKINYIAPTGGETLFTLSGVTSMAGIKVDIVNKIVTLPANNNSVTITSNSGYTLSFASGGSSGGGSSGGSSSGGGSSGGGASSGGGSSGGGSSGGGSSGGGSSGGGTKDTTPASTTLDITNSTKSPVTLGSAYKNANASKRTSAVKITGNSQNNSIIGGSGADTLAGASGNDTLTGGKSNDVFIYSAGKDVITDYATGDKISLGAAVSKTSLSGSDVIFTIGSGTLTVKNAKGKTLSMIDKSGKSYSTVVGGSTTLTVTNSTKSPVTIDSAIKTVDASKRTTAVKITGNALDNSILGGSKNDSLYGGNGNDSILGNAGNDKLFGEVGNDTLWGGAGNDTLTGGDGNDIFIYSAGKDVIADYATGDKISIGAAVSKSSVSGSDVIFTIGSGTLTVKNGKGKTLSMIDKSGKAYTTVVGGSTTLTVTNSTKSPVIIDSAIKTVDASKRTSAVKITGNALDNSILGGSKNDSLYGGNGNDSILGNAGNDKLFGDAGNDSLWGGAGNDTLTGGDGSDVFIYSAGKDVIADYASGDKISIGAAISKTSLSGSDVVFTVGSGTLTVKNAKGKTLSMIDKSGKAYTTVVGGSTTLTVTNSTKSPVIIDSAIKTVDASKRTSAVKITGNALDNSILGGSKNDSLYGGNGNDSILGNAGNDKLFGDAGNDTLWGGAGNDTLTGGDGSDVFIYSAGKDVITDYATGDKISLGAAVSKATVSGSDVVFTIGSGSLIVKNGKGKTLSMIDKAGKSYSTVVGSATTSTTLTVTNSTKSPVTIGSAVKTVDASKRTSAVKITANSLDNTILGGSKNDSLYGAAGNDSILGNAGNDKLFGEDGNDILKGGAGNDSLWGGKGNDSLWGDAGNDTFLYSNGDGKDVIYGFENNDLLQITGTFSAAYNKSKKEIAFKVGSTASAITLKDFSATSFNINGDSYKISGTKLVKK